MNSDKLDTLLFALHNLQNLDFHLTEVPCGKINRKEEKEMKQTFRLKKQSFTFDKKGMILRGEVCGGDNEEQIVLVKAWDIYLNNKDIMSDNDVEMCLINGVYHRWGYFISEVEPLNHKISLSKLEYELLKYYIEHGYQYIARDDTKVLFVYDAKPYRMQYQWKATENIKEINFDDSFSFIKWEDEEPYSIKYILDNCEVNENE